MRFNCCAAAFGLVSIASTVCAAPFVHSNSQPVQTPYDPKTGLISPPSTPPPKSELHFSVENAASPPNAHAVHSNKAPLNSNITVTFWTGTEFEEWQRNHEHDAYGTHHDDVIVRTTLCDDRQKTDVERQVKEFITATSRHFVSATLRLLLLGTPTFHFSNNCVFHPAYNVFNFTIADGGGGRCEERNGRTEVCRGNMSVETGQGSWSVIS